LVPRHHDAVRESFLDDSHAAFPCLVWRYSGALFPAVAAMRVHHAGIADDLRSPVPSSLDQQFVLAISVLVAVHYYQQKVVFFGYSSLEYCSHPVVVEVVA